MATHPFPIDAVRTAMAIGYKNDHYIADQVLPRLPVGSPSFKYNTYPMSEAFRMPDATVGRRSMPNQVHSEAGEAEDAVQDYALEDLVPQSDIDAAKSNKHYDPMSRAVEAIVDMILIGREKRVADMVFNSSNYPTANKVTLSGTSQLSDFDNSDPIGKIAEAMDACLMTPNVMVMGQAVYTKLSQHPKVVKAYHGNAGDSGKATRDALAKLFEVDEVLVGKGRLNTAKPGKTPVLGRIWGKDIALLYRSPVTTGLTFGFTGQFGTRTVQTLDAPRVGVRGAKVVKVAEQVKEVLCAPHAGFLIKDAVA